MQHLMQQRDSAQQAAKTATERQTAGSDAQQVSVMLMHALSSYHTAADAFGKHRTSCRSRQLTHIE